MSNTFCKIEKLKSKKLIEFLFIDGKRVNSFPIQLKYLAIDHKSEAQFQVGFSVPKRLVKLAVNRNRIKRLMREAYRKNKIEFSSTTSKKHIFMFVYQSSNEVTYREIEQSMLIIAKKLHEKSKKNDL